MIKKFCVLTLFAFFLFSFKGLAGESKSNVVDHLFKISLPEGFIIQKNELVDFDVYRISKKKKVFVSIFIGNFPDFPVYKKIPSADVTRLKSLDFQMVSVWKENHLAVREILCPTANKEWGGYLHAWTEALSPDEMVVADKILSSVIILKDDKKLDNQIKTEKK